MTADANGLVPERLPDDVEIPRALDVLLADAVKLSRGEAREWWGLCRDWLQLRCAQDAFKAAQSAWVRTSFESQSAMSRACAINHVLGDLAGHDMRRTEHYQRELDEYLAWHGMRPKAPVR